MPNLEYELALLADRNNDEHEQRVSYEHYRAQEIENDLEAAQSRIATLEAALMEAAHQIDIGIALSQIKDQECEDGGFGIVRIKQVDIKPTPNGDKYRAIAKGENNADNN